MSKWLRQYEITIRTPEGEGIVIKPPISAQIELQRNTLADANDATVTVYNLGRSLRSKLFKDRYELAEYWQIIIKAGYDRLYTIFQGNIQESQSSRDGPTWATEMQCYDGMFAIQNGFSNFTLEGGASIEDMVRRSISDLPNAIEGILGEIDGESERGQTISGNTWDELEELVDGNAFIDGEAVNILSRDEVIAEQVFLLDGRQMLRTPSRRDTFVDVSIVFTPEVQVGYLAEIRSSEEEYNGQYKILGFSHTLYVGEDTSGEATTELQLDVGAERLRLIDGQQE